MNFSFSVFFSSFLLLVNRNHGWTDVYTNCFLGVPGRRSEKIISGRMRSGLN